MWRILIADDQENIRLFVRRLLECQEGWEVCGEASDGKQAIDLCKSLSPDLVVLDLHMPNINGSCRSGADTIRFIARTWPKIRILVLSADESVHFAIAAQDCGAHGFLSKAQASTHLREAVGALLGNESYFPGVSPERSPLVSIG
jgi:DNA-binding NarL/FixJ family response regulator